MTDADEKRSDDIALAGEYALHLLDADARRAFEARLAAEPDLRALLREWNEGFVSLADDVKAVAPPRSLKGQIEKTLFASAQTARPRVSFLGWFGGAVAAAVLAIAVLAVLPQMQDPAGPVYTAEIAAEDHSLIVQASYDAASGTLSVDRIAGTAATGRALELWLIADGADAPISLGVMPENAEASINIPPEIVAAFAGGTFAISDEPPGGSPTGQPTGAVLAVGLISVL